MLRESTQFEFDGEKRKIIHEHLWRESVVERERVVESRELLSMQVSQCVGVRCMIILESCFGPRPF